MTGGMTLGGVYISKSKQIDFEEAVCIYADVSMFCSPVGSSYYLVYYLSETNIATENQWLED